MIGDLTFSLVWTATLERQLLTINIVHIYLGVNLPAVLNQNALPLVTLKKRELWVISPLGQGFKYTIVTIEFAEITVL